MKLKRTNLIIFIALITFLFFLAPSLFGLFLKITPLIIIAIVISFFIKKSPNRKTVESESIFNKRIKKFKSIKRGYYSLIIIIVLYILSLITPLWMNNKPLMIAYANGTWDKGETFKDFNANNTYDNGEDFSDNFNYYFPAIWDLLDFIPGISYPVYEAKKFNQTGTSVEVDFRLLNKTFIQDKSKNYLIMPFYQYHPHEDLKDQLDEEYTDSNQNGTWDKGETFIDENQNGAWDQRNPPTLPDGLSGRYILGTDNTGRDVFARLIDGYKISITFSKAKY